MTLQTTRVLRLVASALTTGLMGAGTVILGSISADGMVKPGTWIIAGVSGVVFLCKDVQASLSTPPQGRQQKG